MRLHPYVRGEFPRHVLYALWRAVEDDGAAIKLFYAQTCASEALRGDLTEFVAYFTDPKRVLYIAQSTKTDDLAGMVWFDDIQPGHRAAVNMFFRRRCWGPTAREGVRLACGHAFAELKVQTIWGYTPWKTAWRLGEAMGFTRVAVLPGFVQIQGTAHDIHVMRLTREAFHG